MAESETSADARRGINAVMREGEKVLPLELFFDLVFVLALTQCTALMAANPSWEGIGQGLMVLAVLWWSWVGYAWLTSVVNPEEGPIRIAFFAAMAAFLIVALAAPGAFGDDGGVFAAAYAVVRLAHIALFLIASREEPELRQSILGFAVSTAIGVGLLAGAALADGTLQAGLWVLAVVIDVGGPFLFGVGGWKLVPEHFAERHGLIVLIALGESIVAIGAGAEFGLSAGVIAAAVLGITIAACQWWIYFDVTSYAAARRLVGLEPGAVQNAAARDSYSYIHFLMVAGIVLIALGLKKTLGHVGDPLGIEVATALLGGGALYLLGHVAFRLRHAGSLSRRRLVIALIFLALIPVGAEIAALATVAIVAALMISLVTYEAIRFAEDRERIRSELATEH